MDDLDRYARQRGEGEPAFTKGLERESAAFRVGLCLQQARRDAGLSQAQAAEHLGIRPAVVGRMERDAGEIRLAALQEYAELLGQRLVLAVRPAKAAAERAARAAQLLAPGVTARESAPLRGPRQMGQMRSLAEAEWPV